MRYKILSGYLFPLGEYSDNRLRLPVLNQILNVASMPTHKYSISLNLFDVDITYHWKNIMESPDPKYFDYAASVPPYAEALDRYAEISRDFFANPSSQHRPGIRANRLLHELKKAFCDQLHFDDGRLILCSSATEANNTVIEGYVRRYPSKRLLIAEDAHDSIWYAVQKHKGMTDVLKISDSGQILAENLLKSLTPETGLVCLNHVCGELGTVHDIEKIGLICQAHHARLLVDGTQALGHIPIDMNRLAFNYYTFSAHKFGGVRGTGGLLFRDHDFDPLIVGGKQEWNIRGGTEHIAGLGAAVTALEKSIGQIADESSRLNDMISEFLQGIKTIEPSATMNTPRNGLPGFVSLSFAGYNGHEIVAALSLSGYSVSTGSACHANQTEPSRILLAIGRSIRQATGSIRISMGYGTSQGALNGLLDALRGYFE